MKSVVEFFWNKKEKSPSKSDPYFTGGHPSDYFEVRNDQRYLTKKGADALHPTVDFKELKNLPVNFPRELPKEERTQYVQKSTGKSISKKEWKYRHEDDVKPPDPKLLDRKLYNVHDNGDIYMTKEGAKHHGFPYDTIKDINWADK